jgi:hypothetical protein
MILDSMDLAGPAAQAELVALQAVTVGTVLEGGLFPALDVGMTWVCTRVEKDRWEFDGRFFGQPLFQVAIVVAGTRLQLEGQEPVL